MADEVLKAALAGLLHDVGRFALRAGEPLPSPWDKQTEQSYGYRHALAAGGFVNEFVPDVWREDLSAIGKHHRPKTQADHWVWLADQLSNAEPEQGEDAVVHRMQSVFSNLGGHQKPAYLPLVRLNPTSHASVFPQPASDKAAGANAQQEYRDLWRRFGDECRARGLNQIDDLPVYLETLLAILQEFTWSIPAAGPGVIPDVSLFDHLRTTAAIAACLAADGRSADWCQKVRQGHDPVCLLVGADLSGLQSFIYTLASSGAAKSLRARSFYIQLISEALAFSVAEALDLPATNLIYVGGGGFQLLAPVNAQARLAEIRRDLADRLLMLHEGALGLTLMWQRLAATDLADFGKARDKLGRAINQAKRQPFAAASPERLAAAVGQALTEGGDPDRFCRVTGEDGPTVMRDKDGEWKAAFVLSLEELGRRLPRSSHIVLAQRKAQQAARATDWRQALAVFGVEAQVVDQELAERLSPEASGIVRIWRLAPSPEPSEANWLRPVMGTRAIISYRPLARLTPLKAGAVATFDDLAKPLRGTFQRWGVLRMDVDNLGRLFQSGFGQRANLSRVASLSFALRLFFEGWLPQLAAPVPNIADATDDLRDHLYLQYSGGDDVFIVGAWDALPEFARRVRQSLSDYAAGNPQVTLSAGISLADAGFPLYQAAQQAMEAEDAAKNFKRQAPSGQEVSKDAVVFMGMPLDWAAFGTAKNMAYHLAQAIEARQMPRSTLQTVQALDGQIRQAERKARLDWLARKDRTGQKYVAPKLLYGRWTWMAAYQLTRTAQAGRDEGKQLVEEIEMAFLQPDSREQLRALGLSARWAQYLTRGG